KAVGIGKKPSREVPFGLSMPRESSMVVAMFRECCLFSALAFCGLQTVTADTIQLQEKAAITGKIVSEKRDQIAVNVGYTVLVIPRNQVAKTLKPDKLPKKVVAKPAIPVEAK